MISAEQISQTDHGTLGIGRWSIYINNGYWQPRNFDVLIIELLQYALQGKVSKILLGVPSRHGKSTLISKNFASYFLAHFPNDKVILTAYSQGLASEFGGQVKDVLNYYGGLSPYNVSLSTDSKAKNKFKLNHPYRGQMLAVGAGGSILGFGAGLFIVDDPIKNVADAESKVKQQRLADWFGGTAKTRLERRTNGKPPIMLVIAQRLHLKDLHGIIRETEPTIDAQTGFKILRNGGTKRLIMANKEERIAGIIRKSISEIITMELKNPHLGFVTIPEVKVSKDFSYAKVYVSFMFENEIEEGMKVLEKSKGFIRSGLAKRLDTRRCPELVFILDESFKKEARITELLNKDKEK
jgi:ribosome-binding factor A